MSWDRQFGSIDDEYGLPVEELSCPGCGRSYKQQRTVCRECQECKTCCKAAGLCKEPHYVPARVVIEIDILEWPEEQRSESVVEWMKDHPEEKRKEDHAANNG